MTDVFSDRIRPWRLLLGIPLLLLGVIITALFVALSVLAGGVDRATLEVFGYALPFLLAGGVLCFLSGRRILDGSGRALIVERRLLVTLQGRRVGYEEIDRLVAEKGKLWVALKTGERVRLTEAEPEGAGALAERHGLAWR